MTPQETLLKHEDLINLIIDHQYIPHHSQANFGEVKAAIEEITKTKYEQGCSGCITEMVRIANIHLKAYKATIKPAVFYTMPEHKKRGPKPKQ